MDNEDLEYSVTEQPSDPQQRSYAVYEVPFYAALNAPSSAYKLGVGLKESLIDPIYDPEARKQLVEGAKQVGTGLYSKARGLAGYEQDPEQKAQAEAATNALGEYYKGRYGGWENIKRSLAEDPFGTAGDISTVASLGGGALVRGPGVIGKAGQIISKAGEVTDPLKMVSGIGKAATTATTVPFWWKSGVTPESLLRAAQAGENVNFQFLRHMGGAGRPEEVIDTVSNAITKIADEKNASYQRGMGALNANVPVDYTDIMKSWRDQYDNAIHLNKTYDPQTLEALNRVGPEIYRWTSQPNVPGANSVYDVDKLKRLVSNIRSDYPVGSPAFKALTDIRKSIYNAIETVDPKYAQVMEDYQSRLDELKNLRSVTGVNKKDLAKQIKTVISAQKTPAGRDFIKRLEEIEPDLPYMIAGQELSEALPYGIRGYLSNMAVGGAGGIVPAVVGMVASSPKVAGAAQYALGATTRALPKAIEKKVPQMARASAYGMSSVSGAAIPKVGEEETPKAKDIPLTEDLEYSIGHADGGRIARADGGKVDIERGVRALMMAVDAAKKKVNLSTESLLEQPDEHVAQALSMAKRHI